KRDLAAAETRRSHVHVRDNRAADRIPRRDHLGQRAAEIRVDTLHRIAVRIGAEALEGHMTRFDGNVSKTGEAAETTRCRSRFVRNQLAGIWRGFDVNPGHWHH